MAIPFLRKGDGGMLAGTKGVCSMADRVEADFGCRFTKVTLEHIAKMLQICSSRINVLEATVGVPATTLPAEAVALAADVAGGREFGKVLSKIECERIGGMLRRCAGRIDELLRTPPQALRS